jgi:hypothetical protein
VRLLQHRVRQVDSGDAAIAGIQRQVDPGADADLEHAVAGPDGHPLQRLQAAGVERGPEDDVVDRRQLLVHAGDEIRFNGRDRQGPGGDVGGQIIVLSPALVPVEQGHSCDLLWRPPVGPAVRAADVLDYTFAETPATTIIDAGGARPRRLGLREP